MKGLTAAGLGVALLAVGAAQARVFWGRGDTAGLIPASDAAYRRAYTAELVINQGRGQIEVWGIARHPESVLRDLEAKAKAAGGRAIYAGQGPLGWAVAATPDGRIHRILVSAAEGQYCHVFQLSQELDEYRRSLTPPERLPLDVPPLPDTQIVSYLANEQSGTATASLLAGRDPVAVRAPLAAQLKAAGWERLPAGGGDGAAFVREGALLMVTVKRTGAGERTLVTLAHKRLKGADRP